jgi:sulfatase modifying factor 1
MMSLEDVMKAAPRILVSVYAALAAFTISAPVYAEDFRDCDTCPDIVVVPAGTGQVGSTAAETDRENLPMMGQNDIREWERPLHQVTIAKPFGLGKYEVTKAQFAVFINETGYRPSKNCQSDAVGGAQQSEGFSWQDPGFAQDGSHPVVCVSWTDVQAYLDWLSDYTGQTYRLPSEAEWEYAARAGTTTARFWGNGIEEACDYANGPDLDYIGVYAGHTFFDKYRRAGGTLPEGLADNVPCKDGYVDTAPVGSFAPNAFGLHDMLGNAWEWVEDCFHETYDGAPADGSAWVDRATCDRAPKYSSELIRVFKGGAFSYPPYGLRPARRGKGGLDRRTWNKGFRVVRELD